MPNFWETLRQAGYNDNTRKNKNLSSSYTPSDLISRLTPQATTSPDASLGQNALSGLAGLLTGGVANTPALTQLTQTNSGNQTLAPTTTTPTPTDTTATQTGTGDATMQKIIALASLGKALGNSSMDSTIMGYIMDTLYPQNQTTDYEDLLNLYAATGSTDESLKDQALAAYYSSKGQDYSKIKQQQTLLDTFKTDFATEGVSGGDLNRNASLQAQAAVNPSLVQQYYSSYKPGLFSGKNAKEQALKDAGFTL
mgnify:CR=1 FL=1